MMKKGITFLLLFTMIILHVTACSNSGFDIIVNPLPVFGSNGLISDTKEINEYKLPKEAKIFEVIPYAFSELEVQEKYSSLLGDDYSVVSDYKNLYTLKATNGAKLEIDKVTGSFQYATEIFTEMVYEDKLTNVLSEKEYIRKSVDFLQKYNMCFESLDLTNAKVQPLMTIETVENGKEVEYVRLMGVYLYRKPLSGIKFDGVGPRVTVAFDNSGEIVSIHSAWREVKEVKTIPLIDNKGLLQLIEREQYSCSGFLNSDAKLTAIDVIYYMDPIGIEQKYAIPMYKITGTDADDNLIQAYAYAIEESSFKIIAPPTHDSKGGINTIDEKEKYLQEIMKENDGGVSSDGKDENIEDRAARGLN